MMKVGFIVEDKPYQLFINSENFNKTLTSLKLELCGVYFSPDGRDRVFNQNEKIESFYKILNDQGAQYIFILIDNENDPCISFSKGNIHSYNEEIQINIIAVKAIESWFLADSETSGKIFN